MGTTPFLHHLKLSRGGVGNVEDATVVQGFEGDPVVDPKLYFAVVVQVANADARIERQIVPIHRSSAISFPLAVEPFTQPAKDPQGPRPCCG